MFLSQKIQYLLLVVLVTYANAGMMQNFIRSFTGNFQTPSEKSSPGFGEELKAEGNLSLNQGMSRGYHSHGYGHEPHYEMAYHSYYKQDNNLDLYTLLGGLAFASLLGAALIYLASNRTIGRRRRSLDEDWDHITDAIDDPFWERERVQTVKLY